MEKRPTNPHSGKVYRTICPICKTAVESRDLPSDKLFPFCSRKCKMIDLGKWFDGEYRISHELPKDDEDEK